MLAAVVTFRYRSRVTPRALVAAGLLFVGGYLVASQDGVADHFPIRELGLSVAFGCLIVLAICCAPVEVLFGSRIVSRLGYMAHSMLLAHAPLSYCFSEALRRVMGLFAVEGG